MGKKTLLFSMALTGISAVVYIVAMSHQLHYVSYFITFSVLPFRAFSVSTYPMSADVHWATNDACGVYRLLCVAGQQDCVFCEKTEGLHDLQEISQRFCAQGIAQILPNICEGLGWAYVLGLALIIFVVLNLILLGTSCFMTWHYMTKSPKKKYREVALILSIVGGLLVTVVLLMYVPFVLLKLGQRSGGASWAIAPSTHGGAMVGQGYIFLWVAQIIQAVVIVLFAYGKTPEERMLKEAREQAEFEAEMASLGQIAAHMPGAFGQQDAFSGSTPGSQQPWSGGGGGGQWAGGGMGQPFSQPPSMQPNFAWSGAGANAYGQGPAPVQSGFGSAPPGYNSGPQQGYGGYGGPGRGGAAW